MDFTRLGADGQRRWYEASAQPIRDDGAETAAVLVIRDISDRILRRP
jgi:PAS domain S-box-containing protein